MRVSGGDLCAAEAPTEPTGETRRLCITDAVNSYSKSLIYETLGALRMAVELKAVNYHDVRDIEHYLIHDHLNNGRYMTQVYKQWE